MLFTSCSWQLQRLTAVMQSHKRKSPELRLQWSAALLRGLEQTGCLHVHAGVCQCQGCVELYVVVLLSHSCSTPAATFIPLPQPYCCTTQGGHFAAWEQPQLLYDDVMAFVDKLKL